MRKDRRLRNEMDAWLTAEAAGDERGAEAAFAALVGALPRLTPAAGFAERVVWAALPPTQAAPGWLAWLARGGLAAALALVALATGFLPMATRLPVSLPSFGEVVKSVAGGLAWIGGRFETGLEVWELLGRIGEAITVALQTPEAQAGLAGSAILATIAFYTLHQLLTFERRTVR
ncbi:MAG: hypothetical protein KY397_03255 [Gemmatimonadetes bacterium]|nr:hypothetical protein [Gemmatimonadota bacterium]